MQFVSTALLLLLQLSSVSTPTACAQSHASPADAKDQTATWRRLKPHLLVPDLHDSDTAKSSGRCCVCRYDESGGSPSLKNDFRGTEGCGRLFDTLKANGICATTFVLGPKDVPPKDCPSPLYFEAAHGQPSAAEAANFIVNTTECLKACGAKAGSSCSLACFNFGGDTRELLDWCRYYYFGKSGGREGTPYSDFCRDSTARVTLTANQLHNVTHRDFRQGDFLTPLQITLDCGKRDCYPSDALPCRQTFTTQCPKEDQGQRLICKDDKGELVKEGLMCCCSYQIIEYRDQKMRVPKCLLYDRDRKAGFDFPACRGQETFYDRSKRHVPF